MLKTQEFAIKPGLGEIGLSIRTHASLKVVKDHISGGVWVPCLHASPVANDSEKPLTIRYQEIIKSNLVLKSNPVTRLQVCVMPYP